MNFGKCHHTLLHEIKPPNPPKDDVTKNNLKANIDPKLYLQILPVNVSNGKRTVKINALLDAGADSTLIREDIAKQLDLHGNSRNLKIHNAFLKSKTVESKLVNFSVSSKDHPEKIDIKNAWAVPNLNIRHHSYNVESLKETYTYLKDINLPNIEPTDVTLVIGADFPELVLHEKHIAGKSGAPYAIKTKLGWVLMGGPKSNLKNVIESNNMSTSFINPEHYWSVENYGTISKNDPIMMSKDEKRAMSILQTSTVLKNQRYEIPLLWKEDHPKLPNNKELALQRLYSLEKKLQKSPELEQKYSNAIKEYIYKGYAIKLSERETNKTSNITNYIPHHCFAS